ncbi:DsbA family protein [Frischella sp. Ac48]|uniref:Thiol:disulfide interchange protein n=1 Tax=Frischella japonica TaxID=2741544 RepID=A0ABR7R0U1_9GAMM|nr:MULTISPECIES: DsbA family protein [Frischella]MBC9131883.1 DsbA family protein [Frischella japonica]MBX4132590.1 DsbA family protein [Frischella sp. Ac48]
MFKKFFVTISAIIISFCTLAAETEESVEPVKITDGKQYYKLAKFASPEKEVIEFFSFNCSSCFKLERTYKINETITSNLPKNIKFKRYHLNNFGPLAEELSQAWAIANVLGIQNEIASDLYDGIQLDKTIKTADDIKGVFINLGIDEAKYESMKDNFLVKAFEVQQNEARDELQPTSIPSFFVNRLYIINSQGLDATSYETYIKDYSRVINFLLQQD